MTVTIDATVGGANSNSFITVATGTTLANNGLNTDAWTDATADDKARALISATLELNPLDWVGTRATTTQALSWPRSDAEINGRPITTTEIPREVQQATFDLALALLQEDTTATSGTAPGELVPGVPNSGLKRLKLDVLELEWRDEGLPSNRTSAYQRVISKAPSLSTVLYGTVTTNGTGGSGLLVGLVRS
jgi:hypothetical protein